MRRELISLLCLMLGLYLGLRFRSNREITRYEYPDDNSNPCYGASLTIWRNWKRDTASSFHYRGMMDKDEMELYIKNNFEK